MKECPMCSAKAIDDAEVCHACLRHFDEAANAEEDHGEAWEPDLDFVREWAEGKTRERHADLPSLTPWQRMEVEGTVAYAVETWYGAGGMDEGCAEVAALLDGEQEKLDAIAAEYGFTWDADNMTEFDVGGPDGCKWEDGEAVDRALDVIVGICLACHALGFETGKGEDGKWRCAPSAD